MKKLISLLLVLAMALTLVACGAKEEAPAETQAAAPEAAPEAPAAEVTTYDVGVAIYQFTDNFMTLYRQEIEAYFKTLETDTVKYTLLPSTPRTTWLSRPTRSTPSSTRKWTSSS